MGKKLNISKLNPRVILVSVLFFIFSIHFIFLFLIKDHGLMMDEVYHYRQITRFMGGDFHPDPELPMTPGYHLILALAANIFHIKGNFYFDLIPWIRFLSFVISLSSIIIFYKVAEGGDKASALIKTVQYSFFPLTFPFFPLIYTDIFSLVAILLAFWAGISKHYSLSGIIATLAIILRQNNLIWLIFVFSYIYVKENGYKLDVIALKRHIEKTIVFILGPVVFIGYLIYNGRLAMGNQTHVFFTLAHPNNIFIMLFLFFCLFLPVIINNLRELLKFINQQKILTAFAFLISIGSALYYHNTHPFNQGWFFLHNWLAIYLTSSMGTRLLLSIVMVGSIISLYFIKLKNRADYLIYPFTILFLWPLWFIEERYYIVPFVFFLLFRKRASNWVEYSQVAGFLIVSLYLFWGIYSWRYFP